MDGDRRLGVELDMRAVGECHALCFPRGCVKIRAQEKGYIVVEDKERERRRAKGRSTSEPEPPHGGSPGSWLGPAAGSSHLPT